MSKTEDKTLEKINIKMTAGWVMTISMLELLTKNLNV